MPRTSESYKVAKEAYNVAKASGQNNTQAKTTALSQTNNATSNTINSSVNKVNDMVTGNNNAIVPTGTTPTYDPQAELQKLKDAQLQKVTTSLDNKYNQVMSDINSKKSALPQVYDDKRNTAQVSSELGAKNFSEFLANRGLSRSGTSQQAELTRNLGLQNQLTGINREQYDQESYYNKLADDTRSTYNNDMSGAVSGVESDYLNNLIKIKTEQEDQKRAEAIRQQEFNYQLKRDAVSDTRYNDQTEYNKSQDKIVNDRVAQEDYLKSILGLGDSFDYQAEINRTKNDGDVANDWKINLLNQARQDKINTNLQKDISTIGRYSSDYQAEINKRTNSPTTIDDSLIPYLEMAKKEKLAQIEASKIAQIEAQRKAHIENQKLAMEQQKVGIEQQKANYTTSKPYYKTESSSSSNAKVKKMTYAQAEADVKAISAEENYSPTEYDNSGNRKKIKVLNTGKALDRLNELYNTGRINDTTLDDLYYRLKIGE